MSAGDNPLDIVWTTYKSTRDCLTIAERARNQEDLRLLRSTDFTGLSQPEAAQRLKTCHDESENFAIILLWAVFERYVISYVQTKGSNLLSVEPSALAKPLFGRFESAVEYWKIEDVLDILKGVVDPRLLGDVKNIKKYRDWVVHRNPKRRHEGKADPKLAYRILTEVIETIGASG